MTRPYACRKLLEHGPLTLSELLEITRWPYRCTTEMLQRLIADGSVAAEKVSPHRNVYRIA